MSTIDEPHGAFTCWSSILAVLADSGLFHGLLITITWVMNHSYMGYQSPFWGSGVISTIDEPRGAFTCWSSTLAVLADSGLFHGLLIIVTCALNHRFESPERSEEHTSELQS